MTFQILPFNKFIVNLHNTVTLHFNNNRHKVVFSCEVSNKHF